MTVTRELDGYAASHGLTLGSYLVEVVRAIGQTQQERETVTENTLLDNSVHDVLAGKEQARGNARRSLTPAPMCRAARSTYQKGFEAPHLTSTQPIRLRYAERLRANVSDTSLKPALWPRSIHQHLPFNTRLLNQRAGLAQAVNMVEIRT